MADNISVTVIVPIYNVEKFIERTLRSYFEQTVADSVEYILVNDCSTDSTMQIVNSVVAEYPRLNIRIIQHETNKGVGAARNTGLGYLGENSSYILFWDADDYVEHDMLEQMLRVSGNGSTDIVCCDIFDDLENRIQIRKSVPADTPQKLISEMFKKNINGGAVNKMIKRSIIQQNGIFFTEEHNIDEDVSWVINCALHAKSVSFLSKPLYHYVHDNTNSIMHSTKDVITTTRIWNTNYIKEMLVNANVFSQFEKDFALYCLNVKYCLVNIDPDQWRSVFPESNKYAGLRRSQTNWRMRIKEYIVAHTKIHKMI